MTIARTRSAPAAWPGQALLAALARLDLRLARAEVQARTWYGATAGDPFRGLQISAAEIEALLARPPGAALLWSDVGPAAQGSGDSAIARLSRWFELVPFD